MNTKETQKEFLGSGETDILRKVRDRSQTAKIASAVAAAVVTLVPVTAKALEELGIEAGDDVKELYGDVRAQLNQKIPEDRFSLTFDGLDCNPSCDDHIYEKEYRVEDGDNGHVIIRALTNTSVVEGFDGDSSYFELINSDGTVKHKVASSTVLYVDNEIKWDNQTDICSDLNYNDVSHVHPTHDGDLKVITNLVLNTPNSIFRVSNLEAPDYCAIAVPDPKENGPFEEIVAPECKLPSGHIIVGHTIYKEKYDKFHPQIFVYDLNGNLVPYQRNADGTWIPESTPKGNADFVEMQWPAAFSFRQTQSGKQVVVGVLGSASVKFWVLEVTGYTPNGMPILSEVPFTVEPVDPNALPPDADGDGISDADEEASGGCVGYTDAGENFVDTNGNGQSDTCEPKCIKYANEYAGQMTASDSLPCTSDLLSPGGPAKQLKDGSHLLWLGTEPILENDGTISAQPSSKLMYIHTTLVGTGDPEPARKAVLPDGYETSIQVHSGTAHVSGFDFLGEPVKFTVTPESGLVDLGFVYGAEVGVEGSDYELIIGSEYQPCGVAVCGNQNPEPPPVAEPAQTADEPMAQADEGQSQAEEGATQTEIPQAAEPSQAEPNVAESMPDVYSAPDAESETAEEAGGVIVPPAEPMPEPTAEPPAEPVPDAVSVTPDADVNIAEEAGQVVVPPVDATVSSPEADAAVYVDASAQNPDTAPAGPDTSPDTPAGTDTQPDSTPETPASQDSADSAPDTDKPNPDTPPANADQTTGTDAPVQGQDSQKDMPQGKPDKSQPDANQPAEKDTENPQPKPEDKKEGGGSGGCAIENPDNPSVLNYLAGLGIAAALAILRRKKMAEVLGRK